MASSGSRAVTIYTTTWCGDCARLKRELGQAGVPFREIDIEADSSAAAYVMRVNKGNRSIPTVVFADGTVMTEPSARQVINHRAVHEHGTPVAGR